MNRILQAARFAEEMHRGQTRKYTGTPYICHPARVAGRTMLLPDVNEDVVIAAWLHDVLEDCTPPGVRNDRLISSIFGSYVCDLVKELTNESKLVIPDRPRAERKAYDLRRLTTVSCVAQSIKAIDRIDNLNEMADAPEDFRLLYLNESQKLLQVLAGAHLPLRGELSKVINDGLIKVAHAGVDEWANRTKE